MTEEAQVIQADRTLVAELLGYRDVDDMYDYRLTGRQEQARDTALALVAGHRIAAEREVTERAAKLAEMLDRAIRKLEAGSQ